MAADGSGCGGGRSGRSFQRLPPPALFARLAASAAKLAVSATKLAASSACVVRFCPVPLKNSNEVKKVVSTKVSSDMDLPKRDAQVSGSLNDREYGAGRVHGEKNYVDYSRQQFFHSASDVELQPDSRNDANRDSHYLPESVKKSKRKMDTGSQVDNFHSDSEETDAHKHRNKEKRRHKHRRDSGDTSASDSDAEDRREAKRRRKDERRLRKEEKRRKREEKHRKRLERHRGKQQLKSIDTVTPPSDFERDGVSSKKRSDALEADSEEKRLEIELRERALESLRARKAVGH